MTFGISASKEGHGPLVSQSSSQPKRLDFPKPHCASNHVNAFWKDVTNDHGPRQFLWGPGSAPDSPDCQNVRRKGLLSKGSLQLLRTAPIYISSSFSLVSGEGLGGSAYLGQSGSVWSTPPNYGLDIGTYLSHLSSSQFGNLWPWTLSALRWSYRGSFVYMGIHSPVWDPLPLEFSLVEMLLPKL